MIDVFIWYISLFIVGLTTFVLFTALWGNSIPSKHLYVVSKTLGLLIFTYPVWLLSHFSFFEFSRTNIFIDFLVFSLLAFGIFIFSAKTRLLVTKDVLSLFKLELCFLAIFLLCLVPKIIKPEISDIEKIMDVGILAGIIRSTHFPPPDVWYAGKTINYYYFGHYVFAFFLKLLNIWVGIGFNLIFATIWSLAIFSFYNLGLFISKSRWIVGLVTCLTFLAGNLNLALEWFVKPDYSYWDARGLIKNAITEFPAYTFIIGEVHAYVLNLPFVVLFIYLLLLFYSLKNSFRSSFNVFMVLSFVLASFIPTNSWDYLIYLGLLGLFLIRVLLTAENRFKSVLYYISYLIIAFTLFLPFLVGFHNPTGGIGFRFDPLNYFHPALEMFGVFFFIFGFGFLIDLRCNKKSFNRTYLMIGLYAILLTISPFIFFLKDIYFYANPPYFKANTVFKFWFQAWMLFGLVSFYYVPLILKGTYRLKKAVITLLILFLVAVFVYFPVGVKQRLYSPNFWKVEEFGSIDGAFYISSLNPKAYSFIKKLDRNKDIKVIMENFGGSYSHDNVVSAFTGIPTVLGWSDHEFGWRNNWPQIAARMGDIEKVYKKTSSPESRKEILQKYNVDMVVDY